MAVIVALAAGLGTGLALGTSGSTPRAHAADSARTASRVSVDAAGNQAAGWVAGQVSHGETVACDPAMCALLERRGFPAGNLDMVRPGTAAPLDASLVVATAALRSDLGGRLAAAYAPVALAGFGTGAGRVVVEAAAPDGQVTYLNGFRNDLAARRAVGAQLLMNRAVEADPLARQQLSQGLADSRLIATIGMMAALHQIHLVAFGDPSPGASPGVPLRSVSLSAITHGGGTHGVTASTALLASLRALLLSQQPLYRPASIQTVRLGTGQSALRIAFAAPDPLGLLDASQPLVKISSP
ncbi:MAG: hypothetical protein ACRDNF_07560 [Streptosporangiaceae bacterium]